MNKPNKIPQLQTIIDYWADPTYAASIDSTRDIVNEWYATDTTNYLSIAEKVFVETLDAEDAFWQSVDEWNGSSNNQQQQGTVGVCAPSRHEDC